MAMDAADIERLIKEGLPDAEITLADLVGDGTAHGLGALAGLVRQLEHAALDVGARLLELAAQALLVLAVIAYIRAQAVELAILARELILERRATLLELDDLIAELVELLAARATATAWLARVDVADVMIVARITAFLPDLVLA